MGKYGSLAGYLRRKHQPEVRLSFRAVERIVGGILPRAANDPLWWALGGNMADEAPQKQAWASVRFAPEVDLQRETVRFVRRR
ncbi:MAG: toxin-antitoxin system, antitoxin component [Alphaproteobacteria bacterium]|nr:MAG: toxin-antitoxin system, antitoxin component [Alphaproteobacteria bacterium]PZO33388.1 MAG: toxin-antitoxin system, antitoxin component [Alphaproteobacteria bacterium]